MRPGRLATMRYAFVTLAFYISNASGQDIHCPVDIGAITVDGNVLVAATCELAGTDVRGDVHLFSGGSLVVRDARVRGNLLAERADFVAIEESRIDGNVQLAELVGDRSVIGRSDIRGSVLLDDNRSMLELQGNDIRGDVQAFGNMGGVLIVDNEIDGELDCAGNAPVPYGGGNRVDDLEGQCEDLRPEPTQSPTPSPQPPPPSPSPPPSAPPSPAPEPPAVPPTSSPPPSNEFAPQTEGGGGGAMGLSTVLLLPLLAWRRATRSRAQSRRSEREPDGEQGLDVVP